MVLSYITFENVVKEYRSGENAVLAVDDVSFGIERGELCVVLGPSGAGKTTVLNLLGGMERVTSGCIRAGGREVTSFGERELTAYRREDVGFVFQFYNLMPNLTALENVELAKQICKNPLDPVEVLEQVGLLDRMNNFPAQLSGGNSSESRSQGHCAKTPLCFYVMSPQVHWIPGRACRSCACFLTYRQNMGRQ